MITERALSFLTKWKRQFFYISWNQYIRSKIDVQTNMYHKINMSERILSRNERYRTYVPLIETSVVTFHLSKLFRAEGLNHDSSDIDGYHIDMHLPDLRRKMSEMSHHLVIHSTRTNHTLYHRMLTKK